MAATSSSTTFFRWSRSTVPGLVRRNALDRVPRDRCAGGVGAVRGIRNQDFLSWLAPGLVIRANHEDSRQFAVRSRCRLQADGIHSADLRKASFKAILYFESSLDLLVRHVGVCERKPVQACHPLIDLGVVFHRARAERIEPEIDVVVPGRQAGEVPNDIDLAEFRHTRYAAAEQLGLDKLVLCPLPGRPVPANQMHAGPRNLLRK